MTIGATVHLGKDDEAGIDMTFASEPMVGDEIAIEDVRQPQPGLHTWKLTGRDWQPVSFIDPLKSEWYLHITAEPVAVSDLVYAPRP